MIADNLYLLTLLLFIPEGFGVDDECAVEEKPRTETGKYLDPIWGGICYDNDTCISYLSECEYIDLPYETAVYGVCRPSFLSLMFGGVLAGLLTYSIGLSAFIGFVWLADIVFTSASVASYLIFSLIMSLIDVLVYWYYQIYKVISGLFKNIREAHVE